MFSFSLSSPSGQILALLYTVIISKDTLQFKSKNKNIDIFFGGRKRTLLPRQKQKKPPRRAANQSCKKGSGGMSAMTSKTKKSEQAIEACSDWTVLTKKMCRFSYSFYDIFTFDLLYCYSCNLSNKSEKIKKVKDTNNVLLRL